MKKSVLLMLCVSMLSACGSGGSSDTSSGATDNTLISEGVWIFRRGITEGYYESKALIYDIDGSMLNSKTCGQTWLFSVNYGSSVDPYFSGDGCEDVIFSENVLRFQCEKESEFAEYQKVSNDQNFDFGELGLVFDNAPNISINDGVCVNKIVSSGDSVFYVYASYDNGLLEVIIKINENQQPGELNMASSPFLIDNEFLVGIDGLFNTHGPFEIIDGVFQLNSISTNQLEGYMSLQLHDGTALHLTLDSKF